MKKKYMDISDNSKFKYLYKYLPFNQYSLKILVNKKIWFGPPDLLNDPFEGDFIIDNISDFYNDETIEFICSEKCKGSPYSDVIKPQTIEECNKSFETFSIELYHYLYKKIKGQFGISSFSLKCDCPRMWAHYADAHKGFVIVLDKNLQYDFNDLNIKTVKIKYNGLPHVTLSKTNDGIKINQEKLLFKSKLNEWKSEKEIRFVKKDDSPLKREIMFPEGRILGIIFGERMETSNKLTIINILIANLVKEERKEYLKQFYTAYKSLSRDKIQFIQFK
jgi:hypothetical protein